MIAYASPDFALGLCLWFGGVLLWAVTVGRRPARRRR